MNASTARRGAVIAVALLAASATACTNPVPGSDAYKEGELGNGSFLFACDDGLACLPYSGDAQKFPKAIATGATFDVRFVAKNQQGSIIIINDHTYEGVRTSGLGPYVSDGATGGFVAEQPGFGTIFARDSHNTIIDYVTINIVKPDSLVVYDANTGVSFAKDPPRIQSVSMAVEDRKSFRVVAARTNEPVAGSIPVEWSSDHPEYVEIESYTSHVATVHAKQAGTATLTAKGGGTLEKTINVEVK
jgi:hypothetical protein